MKYLHIKEGKQMESEKLGLLTNEEIENIARDIEKDNQQVVEAKSAAAGAAGGAAGAAGGAAGGAAAK